MSRVKEMTSDMSAEADFLTLRGLLAVESGEVGRGRDYLRQALSVWGGEDEARGGGGLDFGGARHCAGHTPGVVGAWAGR